MPSDSHLPLPQRALVWGAYGFMGRHLTARLLAAGVKVSVLTRPRSRYRPAPWDSEHGESVTHFELGEDDPGAVFRQALELADVVFNFAGANGAVQSNQDPYESAVQNGRIQARFLQACAASARHPHVVYTSSRLVYGRVRSLPVAEDHPLAPCSFYAANKLCCEDYHRAFAASGTITCTICRISNAFGPDPEFDRKYHGVINAFVEKALAGQPLTLFGDGSQIRDYIYIPDLVEALLVCGCHPAARNETFNVGSGVGMRLREAAEEIQRATGSPPIEHRPWPSDYHTVESGDYVSEIGKLRSLSGFSPSFTFAAGLRDYLDQRRQMKVRVLSSGN